MIKVVSRRVNFPSGGLADFAGFLAANQEICKFTWRKRHRQMCRRINQRFLKDCIDKLEKAINTLLKNE